MVRVAGGSKGCHACRKRKKSCDGQRPSCGQCLSRNEQCPGYVRNYKFVNTSSARVPSPNPGKASGARKGLCRLDAGKSLSSQTLVLQRSAVADYCGSYFLDNVIRSGLDIFGRYLDWMALVPSLDLREPSLRSVFLALGAARVGRTYNDDRMNRLSSQAYSLALNQLRTRIQTGAGGLEDEVLASMMFLATYETMEGSSSRGLGWASHTQAALSLVQSQGFSAEWSTVKHGLFEGLRTFAIVHCIGTRKPTFLASPEWTSLPWKGYAKSPQQYLLDLLTEVPGFLQQMDTVVSVSDPLEKYEKLAKICDNYSDFAIRLDTWYETYKHHNPGPLYWEQPSDLYKTQRTTQLYTPFAKCIVFPNPETGRIQLFYWTTHLLLFSNLGMVYQECLMGKELGLKPTLPPFPCNITRMHGIAVDIAKSMEYFLRPETVSLASCSLAFPISIALGYFEYYNLPEVQWFRVVFDHIKGFGVDVGSFIDAVADETDLALVAC
ncbi:hypothetical protein BDV25DRAFT_147541 [Aspergillus avenaceus]|uniref:Zn(2)-C6 fungal-type domain-containing protein n=1 Tax=Aspergillus avenaceus TaxID=36643 RepID=A0A5N6U7M2_ASPAV|nr:hypothetical protein BDV25DRAFT_147541 [Aspergillus avenaceus]